LSIGSFDRSIYCNFISDVSMDDSHSLHLATPATNWQSRFRSREFVEVSAGFVLVIVALWSSGLTQLLLGGAAFFWMVLVTLRKQPDAEQLGLRVTGMRPTLWIVALAALLAVAGVGIALRMHTFHANFRHYAVESGFLAYIVWALMQQFMLQDFFLTRLLRIVPTRAAAVIVAGSLFAVAHLPNPLLVVATLVWGVVACALFLRYRNLYVLGVAHAILGMSIAITVPNAVHHQMRVGLGYWQWHAPVKAAAAQKQVSRLGINSKTSP
jgi:Type II CAAX prenyl endopeptidase Rce1-like